MARTAPVPDIPPIPGMRPSVAVLGGGGDGGGGSGKGAGDGSGNADAGSGKGGENATPDGRNAQSGNGCGGSAACPNHHSRGSGTASRGDPVDVVTGRAFTDPVIDLYLPGPLPLSISRSYSTGAAERDIGLGYGWSHSLAWEVEVFRRSIRVWKGDGTAMEFGAIAVGDGAVGPDGLVLVREANGFVLQTASSLVFVFAASPQPSRYRLVSLQDRHGNRISLKYDDNRLVEITDSVGRVVRVSSTREGRIASLEVKNAPAQGRWIAVARYTYDNGGDLIACIDADGYATTYAYGDDHLLSSHTSPSRPDILFPVRWQAALRRDMGDIFRQGRPKPCRGRSHVARRSLDTGERHPSLQARVP